MKGIFIFIALALSLGTLDAHQVVESSTMDQVFAAAEEGGKNAANLEHWFGQYHPIFLHFPIALIILAGVSEGLYAWKKNPMFDFTVNFLLICAAIFIIPTVLSGLAYEEEMHYEGVEIVIFWWHRLFGITTMILTFLTVLLRYVYGRNKWYFTSLILLIASVAVTAHFGGLLAFGPFQWLP